MFKHTKKLLNNNHKLQNLIGSVLNQTRIESRIGNLLKLASIKFHFFKCKNAIIDIYEHKIYKTNLNRD